MFMSKKALLGQLSDMDLRLLSVFRSVTEAGGLSAAELELNIGRSTISRHLKDLEVRLGVTLCRRGRAGFALTDEGREVYSATLRLLGAMDEFRGTINDMHQHMRGKLTLALYDKTVTNRDCRIADALGEFDQLAPEVKIDMYVEPINEIEKGVMEGRFQLGIIPLHRPSSSLIYHSLFPEQMHLYCARTHPLFLLPDAQISDELIAAQKYAGLGYHSPNMLVGNELNLVRHATAYDQEAVATLIMSGRYVGYLPDHYAGPLVEQGNLRIIGAQTFHYVCEFSAIWRRAPRPSRVLQTFIDCLAEVHQ
jgi:LysR family transcriptional regulator, transcriptional activator for bauABCD operon